MKKSSLNAWLSAWLSDILWWDSKTKSLAWHFSIHCTHLNLHNLMRLRKWIIKPNVTKSVQIKFINKFLSTIIPSSKWHRSKMYVCIWTGYQNAYMKLYSKDVSEISAVFSMPCSLQKRLFEKNLQQNLKNLFYAKNFLYNNNYSLHIQI